MLRSSVIAAIAAAIGIFASGSVLAQTPDGETPSMEGVCDSLFDATPGLYGLCVAYCEAQDLNDVDFGNPIALEKAVPNERILANYNKRKGPGDPDMPCIQPPPECPCWSEEIISRVNFVESGDESGSCNDVATQTFLVDFENGVFAGPNVSYNVTSLDAERGICGFTNNGHANYTDAPTKGFVITKEDEEVCRESIRLAGAASGYSCFAP